MALGKAVDQKFDWVAWEAQQRAALEVVSGGRELIGYFGFVPSFHDAEILRLDLRRGKESLISVHTWKADPSEPSIVDITIGEVLDLVLEGFSIQNVVGEISFRTPTSVREERLPHYTPSDRPDHEVEISLSGIYGIEGFIRCLDVSVSARPTKRRR